MPRSIKAMSSEKKREKKATVDLRVQSTKSVVKMNQPCSDVLVTDSSSGSCCVEGDNSYYQVETKFIVEGSGACSLKCRFNLEATGCKDDAKGDPETTV